MLILSCRPPLLYGGRISAECYSSFTIHISSSIHDRVAEQQQAKQSKDTLSDEFSSFFFVVKRLIDSILLYASL